MEQNCHFELMNLFWTTAGRYIDEPPISPYSFRMRVESAARAGFRGIGLWHTDLEHIQANLSPREMRQILDDNGIVHLQLEFLSDWYALGQRKIDSDRVKRQLFEASAALGASHIKVGDFEGTQWPWQRALDSFGTLCREAAEYGATIGFEFMKGNYLGTLTEALDLVNAVDAPNGGIVIDIVQQVGLGIPLEQVSLIPAERLVGVELNDGLLPGSAGFDAAARRFCGEGEFDIGGFIAAIRATGYGGPWSVEVFNRDYVRLPLDELNERAYRTTQAQL